MTVPFVIAVSGISGAGKSSVIARALDLLDDAVSLRFDDYAAVSTYPADLPAWAARGADVNEFRTPQFADDLRALRSGRSIAPPYASAEIAPAAFILVEEPFGKMRAEMLELIDLAAHIDVPPDVLLARRLLRRLREERHEYGDRITEQLERDLEDHLARGRGLDALGSQAIRNSVDLVLDGSKTVNEIAATLVSEIQRRR
jgi:uridine kinase